jgi:hypothetical protein
VCARCAQACVQFGRANLGAISETVDGKAPPEVVRYYVAFWSKGDRCLEPGAFNNIVKSVEKGPVLLLLLLLLLLLRDAVGAF